MHFLLTTTCLHINQKVNVVSNFNCVIETEGLLKVIGTYTVKMVVSQKWCKTETLLLQTTNRKWYMAYRILAGWLASWKINVPFQYKNCEWPPKSLIYSKGFQTAIFTQQCSRWQDFNWHSASCGPSVIAELLVSITVNHWHKFYISSDFVNCHILLDTLFQKRSHLWLDIWHTVIAFDNFWQKYYWESKHSKDDLFFHLTWLMLLHYLANHENTEIASFQPNAVLLLCQTSRCLIYSILLTHNLYSICRMTS